MSLADDDGRPILHALIAYVCPVFGVVTVPRIVPLEDAVDYAQFGFTVLVDPQDESDLVRWEQLRRIGPLRKWFEVEGL